MPANFAAAIADEHQLDLLLEGSHVGNIRWSDAAAAENADMGELVEVGQGDRSGLHAAHGEAGHGPMGLISQGAIGGINVGDQVVDEYLLEGAEVEAAPKAAAATGHRGRRSSRQQEPAAAAAGGPPRRGHPCHRRFPSR